MKILHQIKQLSSDFEEARDRFIEVCERYQKDYPYFMKTLKGKAERYFNFLRYPEEIRKYIYTTNSAENFNRRIEEIRQRVRGYFKSITPLKAPFYKINII